MTPLKVLLALNVVPHYRAELARQLELDSRVSVEWMGDTGHDSIESFSSDVGIVVLSTSTVRLPLGLKWQRRLIAGVKNTAADVVVFTGDVHYLSTWVAAIVARRNRRKVVFWTHGWTRQDPTLLSALRKTFYRLADGLFLYGPRGHELGIRAGFAKDRMQVIYNSVATPDYSPSESVSAQEAQEWLYVGRLVPGRRLEQLFGAIQLLQSAGKAVRLLVVGDGPDRVRLERKAASADLNVVFHGGAYAEDELKPLFKRASIVVAPSGIGLLAVHAHAYGCPVATIRDAAAPEVDVIADGITGILFRPDDISDMAWRTWNFVAQTSRHDIAEACKRAIGNNWTPAGQAGHMVEGLLKIAG